MGRVRTQTGRSNASGGEGGSRSESRAGERLEPIAQGGQSLGGLPPRPHSVAEGNLLSRQSGAADLFTVPRTPKTQARAHSRAGGEDGPASRLSTSRRKPLPMFLDESQPTAPVGAGDEDLESNLMALKRLFPTRMALHQLAAWVGARIQRRNPRVVLLEPRTQLVGDAR